MPTVMTFPTGPHAGRKFNEVPIAYLLDVLAHERWGRDFRGLIYDYLIKEVM
jgi:hypothetical protein